MKKYLSLIAVAALAGAHGANRPPPSNLTEIQLVTLNDFHGNLEASKYTLDSVNGGGERVIQAGGIDTIGAALQAWRKQDPELLLVGAGDLIGASPAISAMWADEPTIGAMNLLGLRATSVGNHEFDQGASSCCASRRAAACRRAPTRPANLKAPIRARSSSTWPPT
jgi:5'-nucleotidase